MRNREPCRDWRNQIGDGVGIGIGIERIERAFGHKPLDVYRGLLEYLAWE